MISSDWHIIEIDQVCDLIVDCVNKTAPVVSGPTPFRMVRTTNIRNGRINLSGCRFVDPITFARWTRRAKLQFGDVLLTREAPIGEVGFVTEPEGLFLGQRVMQYRANPKKILPRYLLYSMLSPALQHQFSSHEGSGSVVSHIRVGDCFKFKILLPPLSIQRSISELLGALDERIALLCETNATLESIAQALFKSWFIDFDPVRAKTEGHAPEGIDAETAALFPDSFENSDLVLVPKGWSITTLDKAYEINPSRKLKKGELAPYLDMANVPTIGHHPDIIIQREMRSGSKFINGDTLLARITPCLENGKTAFVDFLNEDQTGWGSTEFVVLRPKAPLPLYHGYLLARHTPFREFAIQSMSGTSGRQRIQIDVLGRYTVIIPTLRIAEAFRNIITPIQEKITTNSNQIQSLSSIRDILLPRLISGQLQLTDNLSKVELDK